MKNPKITDLVQISAKSIHSKTHEDVHVLWARQGFKFK